MYLNAIFYYHKRGFWNINIIFLVVWEQQKSLRLFLVPPSIYKYGCSINDNLHTI
jgi:hypothetical protein